MVLVELNKQNMLNNSDIDLILSSIKEEFPKATEKDIIFAILYNALDDKDRAYRYAYRTKGNGDERYNSAIFKPMITALEPFGICGVSEKVVTKEENKSELFKLLYSIDKMLDEHRIEPKDAIKMKADIRVKLNDKFNMEESMKQKRIIVVPQKHDIVCPHTHRECSYWATKEACMKHYGLKEE